MFGFEITLQDNTKAFGMIFPDQSCYAHEPICDAWASVGDMLEELDDMIQGFEVIGPVVPAQRAMEHLERDYERNLADYETAKKQLRQRYNTTKHELEQYEKLDIKFIKKTEEVA